MPRTPRVQSLVDRLGGHVRRWPDSITQVPVEEREILVRDAYEAWFAGELDELTDGGTDAERDRNIGRTLSAFPDDGFDSIEGGGVNPTDRDVVRWCWGRDVVLMSQDEDLLLMSDGLMLPLLEEAGHHCTKRDYALSIVAHHARDTAHHALWLPAPAIDRCLATIGSWTASARAASDAVLSSYLERLASYAARRPVTREEARQRTFDLRRCSPGTEEPRIERAGGEWLADLPRANLLAGVLRIDATDGRMRAEERG